MHLEFREEKFISVFSTAIQNQKSTLLIYAHHKENTGGLLHASIGAYYLAKGGKMVTVFGVYTSQRISGSQLGGRVALRLMRAVSDWAKANKAEEVHLHSTSGIEPKSVGKFLTRLGFKTYGGNYVGRVG